MRQPLIVIGIGPRGLGLILRAVKEGVPIIGIDPNPLATWKPPNMIEDMYMRSPITFDLVTFQEDLKDYSLANYVNQEPIVGNQREIESNTTIVHRKTFISYLNDIWNDLKSRINYIPEKVISIEPNRVTLSNNDRIDGTIVSATGSNSRPNIPIWSRRYLTEGRTMEYKRFISKDIPLKSHIGVIGSGQNAAEVAYSLAYKGYRVTILMKHKPKIERYPLPTYKQWKVKSGLGDYFRKLSLEDRKKYLKDIKLWQPSITPYIEDKLTQIGVNRYQVNKVSDLERLSPIDYFILCAGSKTDINNLPLAFNENVYPELPNQPYLSQGFISKNDIYYTGSLAKGYDGPRQGSLISIGITSKEIIDHYRGRWKE
jgi:lysine/ornithine N-monooxygenase